MKRGKSIFPVAAIFKQSDLKALAFSFKKGNISNLIQGRFYDREKNLGLHIIKNDLSGRC
jgi:hypothetical protein